MVYRFYVAESYGMLILSLFHPVEFGTSPKTDPKTGLFYYVKPKMGSSIYIIYFFYLKINSFLPT